MSALKWSLAAAAGTSLLACSTIPAASGGQSADIYYANQAQADEALTLFDLDNPSCQLWTNWQKLCSRTEENGAAKCATDRRRPVRPSQAFCVAQDRGSKPLQVTSENPAMQVSRLRFCKKLSSNAPNGVKCLEYATDRPFSPFFISHRTNEWCPAWFEGTRYARVETDYRSQVRYKSLYCGRPNVPAWCVKADGLGTIPTESPHDNSAPNQIVIPERVDRNWNFPVIAAYCEVRK